MIARVRTRLRRDGLRARVRDAVRREALRLAGEALDRTEHLRAVRIPDEKLTRQGPETAYHAMYEAVYSRDPRSEED